ELMGKTAEDVIAIYADIAKDPVKAIEELSEKHGYFTLELYRQVEALKEQGRETEAVSLVQQACTDETQRRLSEVDRSLGTLQRAWKSVAGAAKEAWAFMLNIGTPESMDAMLARRDALGEQINTLSNQTLGFGDTAG